MKFRGEPNQLVSIMQTPIRKAKRLPVRFRFNSNGIYDTENKYLIEILKRKFEVVDDKTYKCKHCGEEFDNWGKLMAHYREEHPKGDKQ